MASLRAANAQLHVVPKKAPQSSFYPRSADELIREVGCQIATGTYGVPRWAKDLATAMHEGTVRISVINGVAAIGDWKFKNPVAEVVQPELKLLSEVFARKHLRSNETVAWMLSELVVGPE